MPRILVFSAIGVAVLLILASLTVVEVPENRQAIILELGRPVATSNTYEPNQIFGETGAGLILKKPFIQNVVFIDKRIQSLDIQPQTVLSTDQLRLVVDAYARFRITNPLKMYQTVRTEGRLQDELSRILSSRVRNELGKHTFETLLSPERGQLVDSIQAAVNDSAKAYGAEIVDVRIKRADLPTGTPLDAAFRRMRTAREREALTIRARGAKEAQIVRAEADASAAKTYAESYSKDPKFYGFYRSMEAYRKSFKEENSSIVLDSSSEFLQEFRGK